MRAETTAVLAALCAPSVIPDLGIQKSHFEAAGPPLAILKQVPRSFGSAFFPYLSLDQALVIERKRATLLRRPPAQGPDTAVKLAVALAILTPPPQVSHQHGLVRHTASRRFTSKAACFARTKLPGVGCEGAEGF
eukprot:scaffold139832_cov17-Tisochrysis_lutea.AAC.2